MSQSFFVSQQELADNFSVNRTTVRAWTKIGLPCITGEQGKSHQYHPGITMWWRLGISRAEKMNLEGLTAAQIIALAREYSDIGKEKQNDVRGFADYISVVGIGEQEATAAFYFAKGVSAGRQSAVLTVKKSRADSGDND